MLILSKQTKIFTIFSCLVSVFIGLVLGVYLWLLPKMVSSPLLIKYFEDYLYKSLNVNLKIEKPVLKTQLSPTISFKVNKLSLIKNNYNLLELNNFDTNLSLKKILFNKIIINKFGADYLFVDVNNLMALFPQSQKEQKKSVIDLDLFNSLLYLKKSVILYELDKNTKVKIVANNLSVNNKEKKQRYVLFDLILDLKKNNDSIKILLNDNKSVFFCKKKLYVKNLPIKVNESIIYINSVADKKKHFNIDIHSKNFDIKNVVRLINSNLLISNGSELLAPYKGIKGCFDFNFNLTNKEYSGKIKLGKLGMFFAPMNDLPIVLNQGNIDLTTKKIILNDFKGYYCNYKNNSIDFSGTINDYMKSMDTDVVANAVVTDEFMHHHMSKLIGYPLGMLGTADTRIKIKSKYNKFDLLWLFKLMPGEDILVDGASISPKGYERVLKADLHFEDMLLKIKSIDYFITYMKDNVWNRKSIMELSGNVDCHGVGKVLDMGINIPDPLPSEFFNIFARQKLFKKGAISGKIRVDNTGKIPVLDANMIAKNIRIPSQRLKIKEAVIKTDKKRIHINSYGKFKRSDYKFNGEILNELKLPIIVKHVDLTVDNMNIEKLIKSFNSQNTVAVSQPAIVNDNDDDNDDMFVFNTGLLIVEDCNLNLIKAVYKDINMGNLHALLTLDKLGVLKVQSNKFDFAEGISTLRLNCDLMKHKYYVRLGVKDVNSDLIASTLLGLKKEISGKAKGLIELNTDDSLKLNGCIKFEINNGAIGKVGFLEYVLKFAALFRNPMAMISPSVFVDLVNIPDGKFDYIYGELNLNDNIIDRINIKSSSSQLSSFIVGRFDLESRDAILRIYTKLSNKRKGLYGLLRNVSLNALANRVPLGNTNETNYYSNEINKLPKLDSDERDCQIFLTKVDGDVEHNNFISSLKRIK